jgi:hypothetical protein
LLALLLFAIPINKPSHADNHTEKEYAYSDTRFHYASPPSEVIDSLESLTLKTKLTMKRTTPRDNQAMRIVNGISVRAIDAGITMVANTSKITFSRKPSQNL